MPPASENDFARKVRESEQALLRSVPVGKRPFGERWWWFFLVTASFWLRLLLWPFDNDHTQGENVFAGVGLALLVVGTPLWVRERRQAERRRAAAHAAADEANKNR